jgi:hypothetical protein
LQNLLKIGQLKAHPPDAAEVQRLPAAAARNLADARVTTISPETCFDAAYKAGKAFLGKNRLDAPTLDGVVIEVREFVTEPLSRALERMKQG